MAVNREAKRWFRQAEADLAAARASRAAGAHEWAAFQSQQAAEKALKALLFAHGRTAIATHSVKKLLEAAGDILPGAAAHADSARLLDGVYISSRYPNGLDADDAPVDYYKAEDSEACLRSATSIFEAVKRSWPA